MIESAAIRSSPANALTNPGALTASASTASEASAVMKILTNADSDLDLAIDKTLPDARILNQDTSASARQVCNVDAQNQMTLGSGPVGSRELYLSIRLSVSPCAYEPPETRHHAKHPGP